MRKVLLGLLLTLSGLAPAASEGCGDKFLRVGRGARFQRGYVALHPARILLYAEARSPVAAALRELDPALQHAGHKTLIVESASQLPASLRTGRFDLVMVDFARVGAVQQQTRDLPAPPRIVPIVQEGAAEAATRADREFGCFVTSPGKKTNVLAEIDGVMERQLKAGAAGVPAGEKPEQRR